MERRLTAKILIIPRVRKKTPYFLSLHLQYVSRRGDVLPMCFCLSVSQQDNSKSRGRFMIKMEKLDV